MKRSPAPVQRAHVTPFGAGAVVLGIACLIVAGLWAFAL